MSEILKVDSYNESEDYHFCTDEEGQQRKVDLITSGCLPDNIDKKSLIGREVEVEYTHCYLEMAEQVSIKPLEQESE